MTTKNNDDKQYIWESDSASYTVVEDPRGRYRIDIDRYKKRLDWVQR